MKTTLRLLSAAGLLLLLGTACSDNDNAPYYQFTAEDRQWLTGKNGDTWVFEKPNGRRVRYQLYNVSEGKEYDADPALVGKNVHYYYDEYLVSIAQLDTVSPSVGNLWFKRMLTTGASPTKAPNDNGRLVLDGYWDGYVGNPSREKQSRLNFPAEAALSSAFQALTVRGRVYPHVMELASDGQCSTCLFPGGVAFDKVYYDQQAGIVRLVTRGGAVWDRLP